MPVVIFFHDYFADNFILLTGGKNVRMLVISTPPSPLPSHPRQTLNFSRIFKAPPYNDRTANLGLGGQHSCKQLLALPLLPDLLAIIIIITIIIINVMMIVMMMIWLGEGDKPRQHWR